MDLNKIIITGHVGHHPEPLYTPTGKKYTRFTVATNRVQKKPDGSKTQSTDWNTVIAWGKLSDNADNLLTKGTKVLVEGSLHYNSWTKPDGQKIVKAYIHPINIIKLDKKTADTDTTEDWQYNDAPPEEASNIEIKDNEPISN